jgi:hypothetical protein
LLSTQPTRIKRETVLSWLGGMEGVRAAHQQGATDSDLISLIQVET